MTSHAMMTIDELLRETERFVAGGRDSTFSALFDSSDRTGLPKIAIAAYPHPHFFGPVDGFNYSPATIWPNLSANGDLRDLLEEIGQRILQQKGFPIVSLLWNTGNSEKHLSIEPGGREMSDEIVRRIGFAEGLKP